MVRTDHERSLPSPPPRPSVDVALSGQPSAVAERQGLPLESRACEQRFYYVPSIAQQLVVPDYMGTVRGRVVPDGIDEN